MPRKLSEEPISFTAALPNIQSAIQLHGAGDGYLVKLEVPQSEALAIMKLGCLTQMAFRVTVEVEEEAASRVVIDGGDATR